MTRAQKALGKRVLSEGELELARVKGLPERLTSADRAILLAAWDEPMDVERPSYVADPSVPDRRRYVPHTTHEILWLVFHKLLAVWVDSADRVWVRTTALGKECVRPRAQRRRRRKDAAA